MVTFYSVYCDKVKFNVGNLRPHDFFILISFPLHYSVEPKVRYSRLVNIHRGSCLHHKQTILPFFIQNVLSVMFISDTPNDGYYPFPLYLVDLCK